MWTAEGLSFFMGQQSLTSQQVLNTLYRKVVPAWYEEDDDDRKFTEQALVNRYNNDQSSGSFGDQQYTFQQILNRKQGVDEGSQTAQQSLFFILESALSLPAGTSPTDYTEQALLNMAYEAGLDLEDIIDLATGTGYIGPTTQKVNIYLQSPTIDIA